MRLEHLRSNFLLISTEERLSIVREVRRDRLINKRREITAKKTEAKDGAATKKKAEKKFGDILAGIGSMSPEQLAALAAKLGG